MKLNAACTVAVLVLFLAGVLSTNAQRNYRDQSMDLLRMLAAKPWRHEPQNDWNRGPPMDIDVGSIDQEDEDSRDDMDDELRMNSNKRSAVGTALNSGRRRRQPTPALGKAVTPHIGVGVLSDMGSFFDSLRDNLETLASLSPAQRSTLFQEPPTVVHAPSSGGGGGTGMRRIHALRPLRPSGNAIRSYHRRSYMEADGVYPKANHHDPGLLWTGLGR